MINTDINYNILQGMLTTGIPAHKLKKLSKVDIGNGEYLKTMLDETSTKFISNCRIINVNLFETCNDAEWKIIRQIAVDLKYCNLLWLNDSIATGNNNSKRLALSKLITMGVINKTTIKNMYIVNPVYIRNGEYFESLYSTINIVKTGLKENSHLFANPIKKYND